MLLKYVYVIKYYEVHLSVYLPFIFVEFTSWFWFDTLFPQFLSLLVYVLVNQKGVEMCFYEYFLDWNLDMESGPVLRDSVLIFLVVFFLFRIFMSLFWRWNKNFTLLYPNSWLTIMIQRLICIKLLLRDCGSLLDGSDFLECGKLYLCKLLTVFNIPGIRNHFFICFK